MESKLVDHIVDTVKLWWSNRSSGPEPEGAHIGATQYAPNLESTRTYKL